MSVESFSMVAKFTARTRAASESRTRRSDQEYCVKPTMARGRGWGEGGGGGGGMSLSVADYAF